VTRATVVIPNWNGLRHLPECIDTLRAQTFRDFEVVVVDNASADESVAWLRSNAPEVLIVEREDNGGFSRAVNEGIRRASGEYVALLNNDTAVDPHWLAELVAALDAHPDYDIAASRMVFYDQPGTVNAAGDVFSLGEQGGLQRGRGEPVADYLQPVRVLGACAGAAIYRTSFFADVGLFDEDFFLLAEDTDINLRGLIAGKRCMYVPAAIVRHKDSATIRERPAPEMVRLMFRNKYLVIAKDMPAVLAPVITVLWAWSILRGALPLRPTLWPQIPSLVRAVPERVRAEREGFRLGRAKRRDVWSRKRVPTREIVRWIVRGVGRL
jgi:GT2 family glycosyltransferase